MRFFLLFFFLGTFALVACTRDLEDRPLRKDEIAELILTGKRHLSGFEGAEAREKFQSVYKNQKEFKNSLHCEAAYGLVLADVQVVLAAINPPLLALLESQFAPAEDGPLTDAGEEIAQFWDAVAPTVRELVGYAAEITAAENCEFSIGLDEPRGKPFDYRFPLYFLDNVNPVAEVVFKSRFDALEARFIVALGQAALGLADLLLAHDLHWTPNFEKIAYQLRLDEGCIRERGLVPCITAPRDPVAPDVHLLDWAFLLADNPRLFAASDSRWDTRREAIAPALTAALYPLRAFPQALLQRNRRLLEASAGPLTYVQYTLIYHDANGNVAVDSADKLGVNVHDVVLRCDALVGVVVSETALASCERDMMTVESLAHVGLMLIKSGPSPSSAVMTEVELLVERLYGALRAVNEPSYAYEKIPFSSLSTFFSELLPIIDTPAPNFLMLDISALFRSPKALRTYLPEWTTGVGATGSRFLADADSYAYRAPPPAMVTAVDAYLDQAYGGLAWGFLDGETALSIDPDTVTERALFECPGPHCLPADCLNAQNLYSELTGIPTLDRGTLVVRWPALYLWLPDPSLNGLLSVDLGVWQAHRSAGPGNGSEVFGTHVCSDPAGFIAPDNLELQKSIWYFTDFFIDHFQMAGLVFDFLDSF